MVPATSLDQENGCLWLEPPSLPKRWHTSKSTDVSQSPP